MTGHVLPAGRNTGLLCQLLGPSCLQQELRISGLYGRRETRPCFLQLLVLSSTWDPRASLFPLTPEHPASRSIPAPHSPNSPGLPAAVPVALAPARCCGHLAFGQSRDVAARLRGTNSNAGNVPIGCTVKENQDMLTLPFLVLPNAPSAACPSSSQRTAAKAIRSSIPAPGWNPAGPCPSLLLPQVTSYFTKAMVSTSQDARRAPNADVKHIPDVLTNPQQHSDVSQTGSFPHCPQPCRRARAGSRLLRTGRLQ